MSGTWMSFTKEYKGNKERNEQESVPIDELVKRARPAGCRAMRQYDELVELARVCWRQAQITKTPAAARTLREMAKEYLQEAAILDGGKVPDVGLVFSKRSGSAMQRAWG